MTDLDKYLTKVGAFLGTELDDLRTLARQMNETGFNQQCSYLMGMVRLLIIARETSGQGDVTPAAHQLHASEMAIHVQNEIFATREMLTKRIADAKHGKFTP
jgi:hypothetical protein